MDKIKEAQQLADDLLDECICTVGDDKGALKDEPESVKKSEEDIKKAVAMKEADQVKIAQNKDTLFDDLEGVVKDSDKLKPSLNSEPVAEASKGAIIQRGKKRNDMHLALGYSMDPKAKKNAEKRKEDKISESEKKSWLAKLQLWGKKKMDKKREQVAKGNPKGSNIMKRNAKMAGIMNALDGKKKKK